MGCGSSTVGVTDQETNEKNKPKKGAHDQIVKNGHTATDVEMKNAQNEKKNAQKKKKTDPNANIDTVPSNNPVPKSVAFDIAFDDKLLLRNPPRRLQKLDPLNVPKLTPEMLAEKQKIAEEKREKLRQKKTSASRKSSKRRRELMKAKEFEQEQIQQQTSQIEEQLKIAEAKRLARLEEIRIRQRLKEERAKRAREKAKKMNQDEPDVELDVEKDDHYNASDDSWDEGGDDDGGIFGSPKKRASQRVQQTASASTVDSFDRAFQRQPKEGSLPPKTDDFFDS